MIGRIHGTIIEKTPPLVLIDVAGLGYEVLVPMSTFSNLGEIATNVTLLTHFVVREDAMLLYGFLTSEERELFRALIKVSGIGPKIGLAVLSSMSVADVISAIESEDAGIISRTPGIGKKTAERLILELKGKLTGLTLSLPNSEKSNTKYADVTNALCALGYSIKEANAATKTLEEGLSINEGIRLALKYLSK